MRSETSHNIKHRKKANDEFYTPVNLAKFLCSLVPIKDGQSVLDGAYGTGNFYNSYPKEWEAQYTKSFFEVAHHFDWIITNPPYSCLDSWLNKSCKVSKVGFAYLLLGHAVTPKRIEMCENNGFGITKIHKCKVFKWYGISEFVVWEKGKQGIINYDRVVWKD
jgi:hypothetical protein